MPVPRTTLYSPKLRPSRIESHYANAADCHWARCIAPTYRIPTPRSAIETVPPRRTSGSTLRAAGSFGTNHSIAICYRRRSSRLGSRRLVSAALVPVYSYMQTLLTILPSLLLLPLLLLLLSLVARTVRRPRTPAICRWLFVSIRIRPVSPVSLALLVLYHHRYCYFWYHVATGTGRRWRNLRWRAWHANSRMLISRRRTFVSVNMRTP